TGRCDRGDHRDLRSSRVRTGCAPLGRCLLTARPCPTPDSDNSARPADPRPHRDRPTRVRLMRVPPLSGRWGEATPPLAVVGPNDGTHAPRGAVNPLRGQSPVPGEAIAIHEVPAEQG